jgi:hypothetical protein
MHSRADNMGSFSARFELVNPFTELKLFHDYMANLSPGKVRISVQTGVKSQPGLKRPSLKMKPGKPGRNSARAENSSCNQPLYNRTNFNNLSAKIHPSI